MENKSKPIYQRILLKLSGEALQGTTKIDPQKLDTVANEIANAVALGAQVAVVIGGGNLVRGSDLTQFNRITADQMGMLSTIINGLALRDALEKKSIPAQVMSAIFIPGMVEFYNPNQAKKILAQSQVIIFVGGTGNPLVTTDTAAAIRGIEIGADIILKATKVDGVFAADPAKNPQAKSYKTLTYDEVVEQNLGVMDMNAIFLCKEHRLPLRVFNMSTPNALSKIIRGEEIGTFIKSGEKHA